MDGNTKSWTGLSLEMVEYRFECCWSRLQSDQCSGERQLPRGGRLQMHLSVDMRLSGANKYLLRKLRILGHTVIQLLSPRLYSSSR